jgi:hypothetical protein
MHSVDRGLPASHTRRQAVRCLDRRETYASAFDRKSAVVRKIEHGGDLAPCSSASLAQSRSPIPWWRLSVESLCLCVLVVKNLEASFKAAKQLT